MDSLRTLATWSFTLLFISLFVATAWKVAQARILTALLARLRDWRSGFIVVVTLFVAVVHLLLVVRADFNFPAVPKSLLLLVAVSDGIYLAPRLYSFCSRPATNLRSTP